MSGGERFYKMPFPLAANTELSPSAKLLIVLIDNDARMNGGTCHRSYDAISEALGLTSRTVIKQTGRLERAGILSVNRTGTSVKSITLTQQGRGLYAGADAQSLLVNNLHMKNVHKTCEENSQAPMKKVHKRYEQSSHPHVKDILKDNIRTLKDRAPQAAGGLNVWGIWLDVWRAERTGVPDPIATGIDTRAGKELGKAIKDADELRRIFAAYLRDSDAFLIKQGHALRLLSGRLSAYRGTGASQELDYTKGF